MDVTNAAMCCDNKPAINMAYNQKIGDQSKYINVAYDLGCKNLESGRICLLAVESGEHLANICTNESLLVT
jgi:hypothetical protein